MAETGVKICFASQNGPFLRKKRGLWRNMRDMDVAWNLLTYARKNKLKCAMSNQSLISRRTLSAVV